MISPISFSGTFKVSNSNIKAFGLFQNYAAAQTFQNGVYTSFKDQYVQKGSYGMGRYTAEQTLIVPDSMDSEVEAYCAANGIEYKKYETADLLKESNLLSRIDSPPKGYRKVLISSEILEKLAEKQSGNMEHCKNMYEKYFQERVDFMLRSADKIPATTLHINVCGSGSLESYVGKYGIYNFNPNQLLFDFAQKTDEPDQCVYFGLKEAGLSQIPVYVDDETYKNCKTLGLIDSKY